MKHKSKLDLTAWNMAYLCSKAHSRTCWGLQCSLQECNNRILCLAIYKWNSTWWIAVLNVGKALTSLSWKKLPIVILYHLLHQWNKNQEKPLNIIHSCLKMVVLFLWYQVHKCNLLMNTLYFVLQSKPKIAANQNRWKKILKTETKWSHFMLDKTESRV